MKKILFLAIICLFSCKTDKKREIISENQPKIIEELPVKVSKIIEKNDLEGHTFFRVDFNENKDTIIFEPCFANIPKYSFLEHQIIHDYGQEMVIYEIIDFTKKGNILNYKIKLDENSYQNIEIKKIDSRNRILEIGTIYTDGITKEVFIDSLFSSEIPLVKEADPCPDWENY